MAEGGREYRFTVMYGRAVRTVVGVVMLIGGSLDNVRVDRRSD
jgi:hypothetical protein